MKAEPHAWLRARLIGWVRRARRWRRSRREDTPRYRSPKEIALQNAADSLGVTLGEYYPEDQDLSEVVFASSDEIPDAARRDALREEFLTYVSCLGAQRRRRRKRLLGIVAPIAVIALTMGVAIGGDMPWGEDRDRGTPKAPGVPQPGGQLALWQPDRVKPVDGGRRGASSKGLKTSPGGLRPPESACMGIWPLMGEAKQTASTICHPSSQVLAQFSRAPAFLTSAFFGRRRILLLGYARAGLRRIVARWPRRGVEFAIGDTWRSGETVLGRGIMLKTFIVRVAYGPNRMSQATPGQGSLEDHLHLSAVFRDGSRTSVRGMWERGRDRPQALRLFDPIAATALRARGT